jgi:hypothetical protein
MMLWILGVFCGFVAGCSLMLWLNYVDSVRVMKYRDFTETGGCPAFRGSDD